MTKQSPKITPEDQPVGAPTDWVMYSLNTINNKLDSLGNEVNSLRNSMDNKHGELRKRIRSLEHKAYFVFGGAGVLAFIVPIALNYLSLDFEIRIFPKSNELEISDGEQ